MAINERMFEALQPGVVALNNQRAENQRAEQEAALRKYLQGQEPAIAGQKQQAQNAANLATLQSPEFQAQVNEGGSAKAGDLSVGGNPYAKQAMQGPHQAQAFLKTAAGAYKGLQDQVDASNATIDALDKGNAVSDKIALMNEVKLALGGSGGKAFGAVMAQMSGDPTMATDLQKGANWLQNTPNIPTMQPGWRDAIREDVYRRGGTLQQKAQQVQQQLLQQGPIVAPQADSTSIVNSFHMPVQQGLDQFNKRQQAYQQQRQQMQPQPAVSNPAQANANPTTADKIRSFLGMGGSPQTKAPSPQQSQGAMSFEDWKKANGR